MVLGLNHPRGPLEWGDAIGPAEVLMLLSGSAGGVPRGALPAGARAARRGARRDAAASRLTAARAPDGYLHVPVTPRRLLIAPLAAAALAAAAAPATAATGLGARGTSTAPALRAVPLPHSLPGDASAAGVKADRAHVDRRRPPGRRVRGDRRALRGDG